MKPFGIGNKSKMNLWDSNICHCTVCNSKNRDGKRKERNKNKVNMLKFDDSS